MLDQRLRRWATFEPEVSDPYQVTNLIYGHYQVNPSKHDTYI